MVHLLYFLGGICCFIFQLFFNLFFEESDHNLVPVIWSQDKRGVL